MSAAASCSSSSDSIVNISPSDVSSCSISTSSSASVNTGQQLIEELDTLKEENKALEARIRGYKNLSELFVECRRENEQLKEQVKQFGLFAKQHEKMAEADIREASASPFSLVALQASKAVDHENALQTPLGKLSLSESGEGSRKANSPDGTSTPRLISLPVHQPPSSLPPQAMDNTSLLQLSNPGHDIHEPPTEKTQKQESLGPVNTLSSIDSFTMAGSQELSTTDVQVGLDELVSTSNSSPEILQHDSDRYEEATYQKMGPRFGEGYPGLSMASSSMYSTAGGSVMQPSDALSTPQGLSSTAMGHRQIPSHNYSVVNPPQKSEQRNTGVEGGQLVEEVAVMMEQLNSEPGEQPASVTTMMQPLIGHFSRLEKKERDQKLLINTLIQDIQNLKKQVNTGEDVNKAEIMKLRQHNTQLMQRLKSQQHQSEETLVVKQASPVGDWVHVEHPNLTGETHQKSDDALVMRVRNLEKDKAELLQANSGWKSRWDKVEACHQEALRELRSKLAAAEQQVSTLKVHKAEAASHYERRFQNSKRLLQEEEMKREEAQNQMQLARRQAGQATAQLKEAQAQLSATVREKQAMAAELTALKTQALSLNGGAEGNTSPSQTSLQAEIAMLNEQLRVFAEDFEHERKDRQTAQTARDTAKRTNESLSSQNQTLNSQVKSLQKQVKERDDTIAWTLRQNEMIQQQFSEFKKKLASEWDEKQALKRQLAMFQQQQPRNPYLDPSPSPQAAYTSPAPAPAPQAYAQPQYYPAFPQPAPLPKPPAYHGGAQAGGRPPMPPLAPEHLPNSWTCAKCTFVNFPGRTVCEKCGFINSTGAENYGYGTPEMYSSEHALLASRGSDQKLGSQGPGSEGDLVIDSGNWAAK